MNLRVAVAAILVLVAAACRGGPAVDPGSGGLPPTPVPAADNPVAAPPIPRSVNELAIEYVKVVLALGVLDPGYVDAYYGPAEWQSDAQQQSATLPQVQLRAEALLKEVQAVAPERASDEPGLAAQRLRYLEVQLASVAARAAMLSGGSLPFDEEAQALYTVSPPHYADADFDPILRRIDARVPAGPGSLAERYNHYVGRFAVPPARLEAVMRSAIAEARRRTIAHMPVPLGERFELAFVTGKPWGAYNWYQGHFASRIEINTDLPIPVSRVIELASHEGYPGHHVYNGLLEVGLVRDRGWPEYQVYPLFSPQSLLAEGTADFGVGLAFPGAEKLGFTETLFRLAGFDPREAKAYLEVVEAVHALAPAGLEAARRRLDGRASEEATLQWLQKYTLASPDKARHALAFMDHYRSYVINYSYGERLVRAYVEAKGGPQRGSPGQWQAFFGLLSQPHVPADLLPVSTGTPPRPGAVDDMAAFTAFIAESPTPESFRARYPDVQLVLPGAVASKEFRLRHTRYFASLDARGRIDGGSFR